MLLVPGPHFETHCIETQGLTFNKPYMTLTGHLVVKYCNKISTVKEQSGHSQAWCKDGIAVTELRKWEWILVKDSGFGTQLQPLPSDFLNAPSLVLQTIIVT